jgi:hypothetical protein
MEIKHELPLEFSKSYLDTRKNITLVIQYLEALRESQPDVKVNNNCIRLLMESLTKANEMYQDLNKLPVYNMELRAENHILKVENKRLQKQINEML